MKGFLKTGNPPDEMEQSQARPTPREAEIIRLVVQGKTKKEIAAQLGITVRTVETHRSKIMNKLGLHSVAELIHYAIRNKIVSEPSIYGMNSGFQRPGDIERFQLSETLFKLPVSQFADSCLS